MDTELLRIARWLERQPWNRAGTDNTWVLKAIWTAYEFQREVRRARRPARPKPAAVGFGGLSDRSQLEA